MEQIKSYAKVNLCLLVGSKKNNLHKIKSIFCLAKDLYDEIEIEPSDKTSIKYIDKNKKELKIENCIIKKALSFLEQEFNIKDQYKIVIKKQIPIGSGLGGGSSNAASIIKYITNHKQIPINDVISKSVVVGSDVPFFVSNYDVATVKGYGEIVKKLNLELPKFKIQLNDINCSTKEVYDMFDKQEKEHHSFWLQKKYLIKKQYFNLHNDLEKPCFMLYKKLYNIKDRLSEDKVVKLSGSGSSFILFNKGEKQNE